MEFDSHEAAYEFYRGYAKSVGFGTAKASSRRSRVSKEFIDAKFSCTSYGNKQQSDDVINPRPSPKIGCKASMHVKRRQNGKWYIHSFVKEHNHDLWLAHVHRFRSHMSADPITSGPKIRRKKVLSAVSNQYEEEAKANFDSWHETVELKSPSPFEKQLSVLYTSEIFKKFQVEVLGAAACHLRKEKDDTTMTYAVKDFENDQDFSVEWTESKLEVYCSCHLFEYKGYLCRHAIVVLQMSGVFKIPDKYILQRWSNVAKSRFPISENLEDVESKVRRYNDLCRRAIILGEEGSLSLESYNVAMSAIKEAIGQCATVNGTAQMDDMLTTRVFQGTGEANHKCTAVAGDQVSDIEVSPANRGPKRVNSFNEKESNGSYANKKGKVPLEMEFSNIRTQDMSGNLGCPTFYPRFLTNLLRGGEVNKRSVELLSEMLEEQS
ncbi:hypothetical protein DM860_001470 [Cuscuta australis]|uniref:Protein FAR1-RELATED SEQUENCE n=1 Tax=Cuscuta australis TaxID=267555 RepID=A0A328E8U7_9ASTE|nr:hypothetical protein DM860_001470 [Cuscuta australis]